MFDNGITKVGQMILCIIGGVFVLTVMFTIVIPANGTATPINQSQVVSSDKNINGLVPIDTNPDVASSSAPYFTVKGAILDIHDSFDFQNYIVKCQSRDGKDLRPYVSVQNPVQVGQVGNYEVSFLLHWNGQEIVKTTTFRVTDKSNYR